MSDRLVSYVRCFLVAQANKPASSNAQRRVRKRRLMLALVTAALVFAGGTIISPAAGAPAAPGRAHGVSSIPVPPVALRNMKRAGAKARFLRSHDAGESGDDSGESGDDGGGPGDSTGGQGDGADGSGDGAGGHGDGSDGSGGGAPDPGRGPGDTPAEQPQTVVSVSAPQVSAPASAKTDRQSRRRAATRHNRKRVASPRARRPIEQRSGGHRSTGPASNASLRIADLKAKTGAAAGDARRGGSNRQTRSGDRAGAGLAVPGSGGAAAGDELRRRAAASRAVDGVPLAFRALLLALLFAVALLSIVLVRARRRARGVARIAQLDYLTGLANREGFERMLGQEWRRAVRYGRALGLVFVDLDHFKLFNDKHGHLAGDRLLREVAAAIDSTAREFDYTARLGGDEFVILCPESSEEGLEKLAARIEREVDSLEVKLSIGHALQRADDIGPEDLVARADSSMYRTKGDRRRGRVPAGNPLLGSLRRSGR
ncbi:MAG: diguanylate cyclase [Thermoleophilia bacterium]|nr:diguanylate cyclase [Thermoleophilia bacterium]